MYGILELCLVLSQHFVLLCNRLFRVLIWNLELNWRTTSLEFIEIWLHFSKIKINASTFDLNHTLLLFSTFSGSLLKFKTHEECAVRTGWWCHRHAECRRPSRSPHTRRNESQTCHSEKLAPATGKIVTWTEKNPNHVQSARRIESREQLLIEIVAALKKRQINRTITRRRDFSSFWNFQVLTLKLSRKGADIENPQVFTLLS